MTVLKTDKITSTHFCSGHSDTPTGTGTERQKVSNSHTRKEEGGRKEGRGQAKLGPLTDVGVSEGLGSVHSLINDSAED